ncbi:MAG TPA: hypothetical protein QGH10_16600, partial [Armatimonadota bacterium]|nr:hypothetical protein [Armatimonadota bacterium]
MLGLVLLGGFAAAQDVAEPLISQDFEADGLPEGWTLFTDSGTVEVSTERANGGTRSLMLVDDDDEKAVGLRSPKVAVTPGDRCWASCWFYAEKGQNQSLYIEFWTADGGRPETKARSWACVGRDRWAQVICRTVVPDGATHATVHANSYTGNVATGYFDDIEFGVGQRELVDRTPKPPAPVKHPCGFYKPADVERAKGNLESHEWARNVLASLKSGAQFWMDVADDELEYWIPDTTPFRVVDCPE